MYVYIYIYIFVFSFLHATCEKTAWVRNLDLVAPRTENIRDLFAFGAGFVDGSRGGDGSLVEFACVPRLMSTGLPMPENQ